jgi:hypothetical protein
MASCSPVREEEEGAVDFVFETERPRELFQKLLCRARKKPEI